MAGALRISLETLFRELIDGPDASAAWVLNGTDVGLLRSLTWARFVRAIARSVGPLLAE